MKKLIIPVTGGILVAISFTWGVNLGNNKTCFDSEMQYFKAECIEHKGHKVCKTDEQLIYFNLTGKENLTETEIDSLAEEL